MFNPESLVWRIVSRGVDMIGLSLFWTLLSLPIVTCGTATSALYHTVIKCFIQKDPTPFRTFWKSFKENLTPGIILTLIALVFIAVFGYGYYVMRSNWSTSLGQIMFVIYDILLIIPIGALCYVFPMQARFEQKPKQLYMNAFYMTIRHLPTTVIVVLMTVELIIGTMEYWWPIFFTPILWAMLCALFMEKLFRQYLDGDEQQKFDHQA